MKRRYSKISASLSMKNVLLLCTCAVCIILISCMLVGCSAKNDLPEELAQTEQTAINTDPEDNTNIQTGSTPETSFETMAYMKAAENGSISFDRVEWVQVPSSRAKELGITEKDGPGGFFVYNQEEITEKYSLSSGCSIKLLDWEDSYTPIEISADDFFKLLEERGAQNEFIPYTMSVENGEITRIEEHYVP